MITASANAATATTLTGPYVVGDQQGTIIFLSVPARGAWRVSFQSCSRSSRRTGLGVARPVIVVDVEDRGGLGRVESHTFVP